jgi:hypothetical protein
LNVHRSFFSGSEGSFSPGAGGFGGGGTFSFSSGGVVTGDLRFVFGTKFSFVFGGEVMVPAGSVFGTQLPPSSFSLAPQVFGVSVVVPFGSGVPVTAPLGCVVVVVVQRPSFGSTPDAQPQMPFKRT